LQFLLSNYESTFQVPYSQFSSFSSGPTTISISQAYSSTESAASRTSNFSAPYSIIFNATSHNFAKFSNQNPFQPIPYRVQAGGSIKIAGTTLIAVENEVILYSPSHQFLSFYLNSNTNSKTVDAGVAVELSIPLS
jgi:hypothetical protein